MASIIFDIETIPEDFESLDEISKKYFLKFAEDEEAITEAKNSLGFYPLTGEIVAIGLLEAETQQGCVYFQNGGEKKEQFKEEDVTYISGNEEDILRLFWNQLQRYSHFVTFNGRTFDCPYLMIRSAIHKIRATKNLVPYRYSHSPHIDLADQLSFYDALRRKFPLHMWCRAFDIDSPKEEGMTGLQVKDLYAQGQYHDIARYCLGDVRATKKLYEYWENFLKF